MPVRRRTTGLAATGTQARMVRSGPQVAPVAGWAAFWSPGCQPRHETPEGPNRPSRGSACRDAPDLTGGLSSGTRHPGRRLWITSGGDVGIPGDDSPTPLYRTFNSPDFLFFFFGFIFSYACVGKTSPSIPTSPLLSRRNGKLGHWTEIRAEGAAAGAFSVPLTDFNRNAAAVHSVVFDDGAEG